MGLWAFCAGGWRVGEVEGRRGGRSPPWSALAFQFALCCFVFSVLFGSLLFLLSCFLCFGCFARFLLVWSVCLDPRHFRQRFHVWSQHKGPSFNPLPTAEQTWHCQPSWPLWTSQKVTTPGCPRLLPAMAFITGTEN